MAKITRRKRQVYPMRSFGGKGTTPATVTALFKSLGNDIQRRDRRDRRETWEPRNLGDLSGLCVKTSFFLRTVYG